MTNTRFRKNFKIKENGSYEVFYQAVGNNGGYELRIMRKRVGARKADSTFDVKGTYSHDFETFKRNVEKVAKTIQQTEEGKDLQAHKDAITAVCQYLNEVQQANETTEVVAETTEVAAEMTEVATTKAEVAKEKTVTKDFLIKEEHGAKVFFRMSVKPHEYRLRMCSKTNGTKVRSAIDICHTNDLTHFKKVLGNVEACFEMVEACRQQYIEAVEAARAYLETIEEAQG